MRQLTWMVQGWGEHIDQVDRAAWWRTSWIYSLTYNCHSTKTKITPAQANPKEKKPGRRVRGGIPLTRANIGGIIDALAAARRKPNANQHFGKKPVLRPEGSG